MKNIKNNSGYRSGKILEQWFYTTAVQFAYDSLYNRELANEAVYWSNGNAEDLQDGTDFIVKGLEVMPEPVRLDVTLNPRDKDHTSWFKGWSEVSAKNLRILFGIRTGSNKSKFDFPVLVIGFEALDPKKDWSYQIGDQQFGKLLASANTRWCWYERRALRLK